jgi:hypothetical protein
VTPVKNHKNMADVSKAQKLASARKKVNMIETPFLIFFERIIKLQTDLVRLPKFETCNYATV